MLSSAIGKFKLKKVSVLKKKHKIEIKVKLKNVGQKHALKFLLILRTLLLPIPNQFRKKKALMISLILMPYYLEF